MLYCKWAEGIWRTFIPWYYRSQESAFFDVSTSPTLCLMRASATVQSVPGPWWRLGTKILVCMVFQTLSIKYHILIDKINSKTLTIVAQESWSLEKWNSYSLPKSGDSNSVKLSSEACDPCQGQVPMGIFRAHSRSHTLCLHPAFWLLQILIESPKSPPIRMEKVTWLTEMKVCVRSSTGGIS